MYESRNRRSALTKLFAGAGAAAAAATGAAGAVSAAVETERKREKRALAHQTWNGTLVHPVYTPVGSGDTIYYTITAQGAGGGTVDDRKRARKIRMTDARLFHYMETKSGGSYKGTQCLTLQGMNWRLLGIAYDQPTNTWTLDVRVCDSNPDARPVNTPGAEVDASANPGEKVSGCDCSCDSDCYQCGLANNFAKRCGKSFENACPQETW